MPRKPRHWGYVALENPDSLVKRAAELPEHLRDIPAKRRRLVAGLIEEHGGPGNLSVKEALLIDRIGRLWPYLELIDRAALDAGKPDARPADYLALSNSFVRTVKSLSEIALAKADSQGKVLDLRSYLAGKHQKPSGGKPEGCHSKQENSGDSSTTVHTESMDSSPHE